MQAGKLDRRIRLERATESRDAFNNAIKDWSTLATVWASKQDVRDSERLAAQEVGAEITTRFQIRWSSEVADISPLDRLVYEGKTYDIAAVKEIGRREGLEVTAAARAEPAA